MSSDRDRAHALMRKALTLALLACDVAAGPSASDDDQELYRILEITLQEAKELLAALDRSNAIAKRKAATCVF